MSCMWRNAAVESNDTMSCFASSNYTLATCSTLSQKFAKIKPDKRSRSETTLRLVLGCSTAELRQAMTDIAFVRASVI